MVVAEVLITAPSCRSPKTWLPTNLICRTVVFSPSVIVKTRSTRSLPRSMISGHDADLVAPDAAVGFHDAVDVGLNRRALQRAARLGFDGGGEIGVLDLLVALEGDAVEHRRFGRHARPAARRCARSSPCRTGRSRPAPSAPRRARLVEIGRRARHENRSARSRHRRGDCPRR